MHTGSDTGGRAAHCACGASSSWERAVPSVIVGGAAELPRTVPPPMALAFTAVFITAGGFLMAAVAPAIGVTRVSCGPWPPWQRTKPHVHVRGRLDHTPRGLATPPLAPPTADVAFGRLCVLTSGKHARSRSGRRLPHAPHARRRSDCSSVQAEQAHDMFAVFVVVHAVLYQRRATRGHGGQIFRLFQRTTILGMRIYPGHGRLGRYLPARGRLIL